MKLVLASVVGLAIIGCSSAPPPVVPEPKPMTPPTTAVTKPNGAGGVAPMAPGAAAGLTPMAGTDSVEGAGGGGVQSAMKDRAKRAAATESKSTANTSDE